MDTVRKEDGRPVMLKKVLPEEGPYELSITELFSSPGLRGDPKNHCVPLLELIDLSQTNPDGRKLMVMPLLRPFKNPRFQTYGEFVAFFMQISEVGSTIIEQNLQTISDRFWSGPQIHARKESGAPVGMVSLSKGAIIQSFCRDCTVNNIMFDPSGMYPNGYHPVQVNRSLNFKGRAKRYSRTERPPRYYMIDFGLSRRYSSRNALDDPLRGGDKSAPEHGNGERCNPFHTDIYYLGNLVREFFLKVRLTDLASSFVEANEPS